mmetsp:Transcript_6455/g.8747  ORF Transcript_6455/g.8747 Transcript_6455/m.8747 type:complete len:329 (-) Transcript_6455:545-1531(-)
MGLAVDLDLLLPVITIGSSLLIGVFLSFIIPIFRNAGNHEQHIKDLKACKAALFAMIKKTNSAPIMVRLAWHDSGTYNAYMDSWPQCGGANGSIRFEPEIDHAANAGLRKALAMLEPFKNKYPSVSWADLLQMASAVAIEVCGGPKVPLIYGRIDVTSPSQCPKEGFLPAAAPPFADGSKDAATHLRKVFYRMGFSDQEIVALSGAHTIGRAFKDRSGTTEYESGGAGTRFTCPMATPLPNQQPGDFMPGGQSWTENWLEFDNSYFKPAHKDLLRLPTDSCLKKDKDFQPFAIQYANNLDSFLEDYAQAHKKLSELGAKFDPAKGISI